MRRAVQTFDPAPVLARYPNATDAEIAAVLGVTKGAIRNWRQGRRRLHAPAADRIACVNLGVHPGEIWPDDWFLPTVEGAAGPPPPAAP